MAGNSGGDGPFFAPESRSGPDVVLASQRAISNPGVPPAPKSLPAGSKFARAWVRLPLYRGMPAAVTYSRGLAPAIAVSAITHHRTVRCDRYHEIDRGVDDDLEPKHDACDRRDHLDDSESAGGAREAR